MPLRKVLAEFRLLSKKTLKILIDSEIACENKVFEWKIRQTDECLLHEGGLDLTMVRINPLLQLVSEVKFYFPSNIIGPGQRCHKLYQRVAEIIIQLPKKFDTKRVSIQYSQSLMPEWTKCDYILTNERPDMRFKAIVVSLIDNDSPKILEYLMNKTQILKVNSC